MSNNKNCYVIMKSVKCQRWCNQKHFSRSYHEGDKVFQIFPIHFLWGNHLTISLWSYQANKLVVKVSWMLHTNASSFIIIMLTFFITIWCECKQMVICTNMVMYFNYCWNHLLVSLVIFSVIHSTPVFLGFSFIAVP